MPRKMKFSVNDVVEAAFNMIRKSGWEGLSVTSIAKSLGSSTMPIYSHFENLEMLKDEVVKKSWELAMEYEARHFTGDPWVDQAIGYLYFARDEKNLFLCMMDSRNQELKRKMLVKHWYYLAEHLTDYEGFKGLSKSQCHVIRYARAMLTTGVAISVSLGGTKLMDKEGLIEKYMTSASYALLEGHKELYNRDDADVRSIEDHFIEMMQLLKKKSPDPT